MVLINGGKYCTFFKDLFKENNSTLLNPQSNHKNDDNNENLLLDDLMDIIDCK